MAKSNNTLCLDKFYPEKDLMITDIDQQSDKIIIQMKSTSSSCKCPKCNRITQKYHGTYTRKVQDLPILGKNVQLEICSHEYACLNDECEVISIAETFDGFLNNYSRMTERCVDFICTLALETSCEGCARVCRTLGIKTSGDTVIRLLLKRYESLPQPEVSDVIGVDDFAYKKRHTYGTIIVNEKTHEPITLLNGRNGDTLREWLKNNKNVKVVTRDRASAYAKVTRKTSKEALEEKIEKAEADVIAAKKKYDQATANLKELLDKRDAIRKEEILSAVVKSGRSYEEIMNFLNAGSDGEKTEK